MVEMYNGQNGALRFCADQLGSWKGASYSVYDRQEDLWVMQENQPDVLRFEEFKDAAKEADTLNKTVGWTR